MNYLAHVQLAPRDPRVVIGAIMEDFRKHLLQQDLPAGVLLGMEHHRHVDRYTDTHPVILGLKPLFSRERRRYAGIIIDITFDHFLSRHWCVFNTDDRLTFIAYIHDCLRLGGDLMPPRMRQVMGMLVAEDWLGSYADLEGVETSLNRLSRRIRFRNKLYGAIEEVRENYAALEQGFLVFFPELQAHLAPRVPAHQSFR